MKKILYVFIGLLVITLNKPLLAKTNLHGLVRSGQYSRGALLGTPQPEAIKQSLDAVYSVGTYPLYTPELAPGEGLDVIQGYCNLCHSVSYITMQPPLSADTWEAEVYKMINTYGALISEDETKRIIVYLQTHYTQETRKQ
ncbi:MAG: sulfide dehydrogenase [Candidatus Brocadia sp. WS118]|nr:MAG: sulfide dehydrogenase [Candidatus Brocadia sp. WS118]